MDENEDMVGSFLVASLGSTGSSVLLGDSTREHAFLTMGPKSKEGCIDEDCATVSNISTAKRKRRANMESERGGPLVLGASSQEIHRLSIKA